MSKAAVLSAGLRICVQSFWKGKWTLSIRNAWGRNMRRSWRRGKLCCGIWTCRRMWFSTGRRFCMGLSGNLGRLRHFAGTLRRKRTFCRKSISVWHRGKCWNCRKNWKRSLKILESMWSMAWSGLGRTGTRKHRIWSWCAPTRFCPMRWSSLRRRYVSCPGIWAGSILHFRFRLWRGRCWNKI